jgi:hypothetical protein
MSEIQEKIDETVATLSENRAAAIAVAVLLVILIGGAFVLFSGQPAKRGARGAGELREVRLTILSGTDKIAGATVQVFRENEGEEGEGGGKTLVSSSVSDANGEVLFAVLPSIKLLVTASKTGVGEKNFVLSADDEEASIDLAPLSVFTGSLRVRVESESTGFAVPGASIRYSYGGARGDAVTDSSGVATIEVKTKDALSLRVEKEGFEPRVTTIIPTKDFVVVTLREIQAAGGGAGAAGGGRGATPTPTRRPGVSATPTPRGGGGGGTPTPTPELPRGTVEVGVSDDAGKPVAVGVVRLFDASGSRLLEVQNLAGGKASFSVYAGTSVFVTVDSEGFLPYNGAKEKQTVEKNKFVSFNIALSKALKENSAVTLFRTVDEANNLIPAFLEIYALPSAELTQKTSGGELNVTLALNTEYYAIAKAKGRLDAQSDLFKAGATVKIVLLKPTESNSGTLKVRVVDEKGVPLVDARVRILSKVSKDERLVAEKSSGLDGSVDFVLPKPGDYVVEANYAGVTTFTSRQKVSFNGDAEVKIKIVLGAGGIIRVAAADAATKAGIDALAELFSAGAGGGEKLGECATPCELNAIGSVKVVVSATGYLDFEKQLSVGLGETKEVNAVLLAGEKRGGGATPTPSVSASPKASEGGGGGKRSAATVQFLGVFDEDDDETSKLTPGKDYVARLLLSSTATDANSIGVALRVGAESDVDDEGAGIHSYPDADQAFASTEFLPQPTSTCTDIADYKANPKNGVWKWVELRFGSAGTRELEFVIRVKPDAASGSLPLFYRSFAEYGDGSYYRSPADSELKNAESVERKAGCWAASTKFGVEIYRPTQATPTLPPGASVEPEETPTAFIPGAELTPTPEGGEEEQPTQEEAAGGKSFWDVVKQYALPGIGVAGAIVGGYLLYDKVLKKWTQKWNLKSELYVDAVLPGDAYPFDLNTSKDCPLTRQITAPENDEYTKCFEYDENENKFVFKSGDFPGWDCPIKVVGNTIKGTKADLSVTAVCGVGGKESKTKVTFVVKALKRESFSGAPNDGKKTGTELSEGDDSTKLVYAINEKQVGTRKMTTSPELSANKPELTEPGVQAIAWNGRLAVGTPKTLTLLDAVNTPESGSINLDQFKDNAVHKWVYKNYDSVFSKRGDLGQRIDEAQECKGYSCCANYWCNEAAFKKAFAYFKSAALKASAMTAFKRSQQSGAGEPLKYLTNSEKQFKFVMVAQLVEGSKQILKSSGITLNDYEVEGKQTSTICNKDEWPGVYEITATAATGVNDWTYSAKILSYQQTAPLSGTQVLCDFMHGDSNTLAHADYSTLASNEEASDEHSKAQKTLSKFEPFEAIDTQCSAKSADFTFARAATANSVQAAVGACSQCLGVVTTLQNAQTNYLICLDTAKITAECMPDFSSQLAQAKIDAAAGCPCDDPPPAGACTTPRGECIAAITAIEMPRAAEETAGTACDNLHGYYVDYPGILPHRLSNADCYARRGSGLTDGECKLTCEPQIGFTEVVPYRSQLHLVEHWALTGRCEQRIPDSVRTASDKIEKSAPRILYSLNHDPSILETDAVAVLKTTEASSTKPLADLPEGTVTQALAVDAAKQNTKHPEWQTPRPKSETIETDNSQTPAQDSDKLRIIRRDIRDQLGESTTVAPEETNVAKSG